MQVSYGRTSYKFIGGIYDGLDNMVLQRSSSLCVILSGCMGL